MCGLDVFDLGLSVYEFGKIYGSGREIEGS